MAQKAAQFRTYFASGTLIDQQQARCTALIANGDMSRQNAVAGQSARRRCTIYPHGLPALSPAGLCAQSNNRKEDAMTGYRINLHAYPSIDPATQAVVLHVYHALLEHDVGSERICAHESGSANG